MGVLIPIFIMNFISAFSEFHRARFLGLDDTIKNLKMWNAIQYSSGSVAIIISILLARFVSSGIGPKAGLFFSFIIYGASIWFYYPLNIKDDNIDLS